MMMLMMLMMMMVMIMMMTVMMMMMMMIFSGRGRTSVRGAHVWTALKMPCESHLVDSFVLSFCVFKICSLLQNVFPYMSVSEMSPLLPRTSHSFFFNWVCTSCVGRISDLSYNDSNNV